MPMASASSQLKRSFSEMKSLGEMAAAQHEAASFEERAAAKRTTPPSGFTGRTGYDSRFLRGAPISLPKLGKPVEKDAAALKFGSGHVLEYQHFSVVMSKSRRIARFAAVNIDGSKAKKIKRSRDIWSLDGRLDEQHQIGEDLYAGNALDRGHLVRREDPVWGDKAQIANDDTFHFTNCAPQHEDLNQKIWLGLENYILQNAKIDGMRISVFTGPILATNDPDYRNVKLPRRYWKVVAFLNEKRLSAAGYLLSQAAMIKDLEFVFGAYKTYQVPITMIEQLTSLDFGPLRLRDGLSTEQELVARPFVIELTDWTEIRV